ncbi:MAG: transglutaminase domain-containing protein [Tissierellia bacterium]|nr:transglutaminase domain-containing protein [Tissierellia bacterium]
MFKRHMRISTIVIFFILLISTTSFAQNTIVDVNNLDKGMVSINYNSKSNMKVYITKGNNKEHYDLKPNANYPLQFGDGEYTIMILEYVSGNQYKPVATEKVNLKLKDENQLYLQSNEMIKWNDNMAAIKKAKELTKGARNDEEKVKAIHDYITANIKYDDKKASTATTIYTPAIDDTFSSQSGICYDYAVLTAGMLRGVDIPTKLNMGYKSDIKDYHAWNEVYVNGKWEIIDTTYNAAYVQNNASIEIFKNAKEYKLEKSY